MPSTACRYCGFRGETGQSCETLPGTMVERSDGRARPALSSVPVFATVDALEEGCSVVCNAFLPSRMMKDLHDPFLESSVTGFKISEQSGINRQ